MDPEQRKLLWQQFARETDTLRQSALDLIFTARQAIHPAVWFEEILSLDTGSRKLVKTEQLDLTEDYFCTLVENADPELLQRFAAWIGRYAERIPAGTPLSPRVRDVMQTLARQAGVLDDRPLAEWMDPQLPAAIAATTTLRIL